MLRLRHRRSQTASEKKLVVTADTIPKKVKEKPFAIKANRKTNIDYTFKDKYLPLSEFHPQWKENR